MTDDLTPGEVGRTIARVEEDVRGISREIKAQSSQFVPRGEYEAWKTAFDREIVGVKTQLTKGIDEIKAEISSKRVSWPAVVSAVCAVVSCATAIIIVLALK